MTAVARRYTTGKVVPPSTSPTVACLKRPYRISFSSFVTLLGRPFASSADFLNLSCRADRTDQARHAGICQPERALSNRTSVDIPHSLVEEFSRTWQVTARQEFKLVFTAGTVWFRCPWLCHNRVHAGFLYITMSHYCAVAFSMAQLLARRC